jgi:hypothetical protein
VSDPLVGAEAGASTGPGDLTVGDRTVQGVDQQQRDSVDALTDPGGAAGGGPGEPGYPRGAAKGGAEEAVRVQIEARLAQGATYGQVAAELADQGAPPPVGHDAWTTEAVRAGAGEGADAA